MPSVNPQSRLARDRDNIRLYADAIVMWSRGFDTLSIADRIQIPECVVARWIGNFLSLWRAEPT